MAFIYTNLYPDTSANGGFTKCWNYTTVGDSIATCSASGYFNAVASRLGIGDNITIAVVDSFLPNVRTTLVEFATLFVNGISGGVVTTTNYMTALDTSPAFTGTPTAPTAAVDTNTTQLANAAFVLAQAASAAPLIDATVAVVGVSTRFARGDHVHPTDTTRAPLASPALTGIPTAPTAAVDTNTTQLATTAMVLAQAGAASPLINGAATVGTSTRFSRQDHIHPTDTTRAPLASPALTGAVTTTGTLGYATGAGGTVTQATSKATGVTLNTATGQITMNAAALAAATIVSFVLTDSAIATTDVLILNHISGGTPGSYSLNARAAAGSATIDVRNNTAGSLSEAIVIQFAIIKAVNA